VGLLCVLCGPGCVTRSHVAKFVATKCTALQGRLVTGSNGPWRADGLVA